MAEASGEAGRGPGLGDVSAHVAGTTTGQTDVNFPSPGHSLLIQRHAAWDDSQDQENRRAGFQRTPVQEPFVSTPGLSPGSPERGEESGWGWPPGGRK